jgi:hypothetical protein
MINTFMRIHEIINEDISRRGFLKGAGAAAAGIAGVSGAKAQPKPTMDREHSAVEHVLIQLVWARKSNKPLRDQEIMLDALKGWVGDNPENKRYLQQAWARANNNISEYINNPRSGNFKDIKEVAQSYNNFYNNWKDDVDTLKDYGLFNEGISVNMSPYKEAIQNADTPNKKSAKRKVEDLFNK